MKKIERDMLNAIECGKENWSQANTRIERERVDDELSHYHVYLHGNHIATVPKNLTRTLPVHVDMDTLAAYPTVTTKSRLRALGVNVYTKAYTTYVDNEAVN